MSTALAKELIKAFVERIERINEEIKASNDDKRDIFAEAKGSGFDVAALKEVVKRRSKDPDLLQEFETIVDLYWNALGGAGTKNASGGPAGNDPSRVHAHEAAGAAR